MFIRPLWILPVLILSACSIAERLPDWMSADVAGPEPPYRFLVATQISGIVGGPLKISSLEISSPRRVDGMVGASWQVCVRAWGVAQPPRHYAVFIQNQRIVASRLSVVLDGCELQTFMPFDWLADSNRS